MFKKSKEFITGFLVCAIIVALGSTAFAATTQRIDAYFGGMKIVVDGKLITPKDGTGKVVEPFSVNGTTYLPLKATAEAFGKAVYWDRDNNTAYLGNMDGNLELPTLRFENAVNIGDKLQELKSPVDNLGNSYGSAYCMTSMSESNYETLLNMKYSRFKGTAFIANGTTYSNPGQFYIEIDGQVVYKSPVITKSSSPIELDINLNGANDFIIHSDKGGGWASAGLFIYFGDAGFYQ